MRPLLERIDNGHTDLIFEYLSQGTVVSDYGDLIRACAHHGDVSGMKYLLTKGATLEALGQYALNTAAFHGHWRLCQFLIERGMNVDDPVAESGETSLHSAFGHLHAPAYDQVVEVLLNGGANVNAATIPGIRTEAFALEYARRDASPSGCGVRLGSRHRNAGEEGRTHRCHRCKRGDFADVGELVSPHRRHS